MGEKVNNQRVLVDIHGTPHVYHIEDVVGLKKPPIKLTDVVAKKTPVSTYVLASPEGKLFDPTNPSLSMTKKDRDRGGRYFRLKKCSFSCYNMYVQFLRTKNLTHFIVAQRRLLDGS
jgi:hypothetical protein